MIWKVTGGVRLLKLMWCDQLERGRLTLLELLELQKHSVHSKCTVLLQSEASYLTQAPTTHMPTHQFYRASSSKNYAGKVHSHSQPSHRLQSDVQFACQWLTVGGPPFYKATLFSNFIPHFVNQLANRPTISWSQLQHSVQTMGGNL